MTKIHNYNKFSVLSMNARLAWVQETLCVPVNCKRDKLTVKAITDFQKSNGITPNGIICKKTFDLLNKTKN